MSDDQRPITVTLEEAKFIRVFRRLPPEIQSWYAERLKELVQLDDDAQMAYLMLMRDEGLKKIAQRIKPT